MKKQIKKLLLIAGLIVCLAALASCSLGSTACASHTDANGDYVCDTCGSFMEIPKCTWHVDNDNDGYCDIAGCEEEVAMEMVGITFVNVYPDNKIIKITFPDETSLKQSFVFEQDSIDSMLEVGYERTKDILKKYFSDGYDNLEPIYRNIDFINQNSKTSRLRLTGDVIITNFNKLTQKLTKRKIL